MTALEKFRDIGPATAKYLTEAGVHSAEHLAMLGMLPQTERLPMAKLEELQRNAQRLVFPPIAVSSAEMEKQRHIKSGLLELDRVMLGGFRTGSVNHVYGPSGAGKMALCSQLAVRASELGRVLWLDSSNSFNPYLVRGIAGRFGMDGDAVLDNIDHATIMTQFSLEESIKVAHRLWAQRRPGYVLVVIDSLSSIFQTEYLSLTDEKFTKRDLGRFLRFLQQVAVAHDLCVIFTNAVHDEYGHYGPPQYYPDAKYIVNSLSTCTLRMRSSRRERYDIIVENGGIGDARSREVRAYMGYCGLYETERESKDKALWKTVVESTEVLKRIIEEPT